MLDHIIDISGLRKLWGRYLILEQGLIDNRVRWFFILMVFIPSCIVSNVVFGMHWYSLPLFTTSTSVTYYLYFIYHRGSLPENEDSIEHFYFWLYCSFIGHSILCYYAAESCGILALPVVMLLGVLPLKIIWTMDLTDDIKSPLYPSYPRRQSILITVNMIICTFFSQFAADYGTGEYICIFYMMNVGFLLYQLYDCSEFAERQTPETEDYNDRNWMYEEGRDDIFLIVAVFFGVFTWGTDFTANMREYWKSILFKFMVWKNKFRTFFVMLKYSVSRYNRRQKKDSLDFFRNLAEAMTPLQHINRYDPRIKRRKEYRCCTYHSNFAAHRRFYQKYYHLKKAMLTGKTEYDNRTMDLKHLYRIRDILRVFMRDHNNSRHIYRWRGRMRKYYRRKLHVQHVKKSIRYPRRYLRARRFQRKFEPPLSRRSTRIMKFHERNPGLRIKVRRYGRGRRRRCRIRLKKFNPNDDDD